LKRHFLSLPDSLKHRFVLTREEERVLCFVMAAFLVGLAVKHYRQAPAAAEDGMKTTPALIATTPTPTPAKKQKRHRKASPTPSSSGTADGTEP
jgi:hypothetical protein